MSGADCVEKRRLISNHLELPTLNPGVWGNWYLRVESWNILDVEVRYKYRAWEY